MVWRINSLFQSPVRIMLLRQNELPIVAVNEGFQASWQNLWIKLDFPTPESPTNTTLNTLSGVASSLMVETPASLMSCC